MEINGSQLKMIQGSLLRKKIQSFLFSTALIVLLFFVGGCTSKPFLEKKEITVTRDEPSEKCHDLGPLEGRAITARGSQDQALENLKEEAMKKGANWIKIQTLGAQGTTVRGQAYHCP